MKFAHELKEALRREGFPPHWVESAVPYGLLKKSIKKVEAELRSLGLDAKTLRQLDPSSSNSEMQKGQPRSGDAAVAFQYQFAEEPTAFRPTLTLYIQLEDGELVDAGLSPDTRKYLASLAVKQGSLVPSSRHEPDGSRFTNTSVASTDAAETKLLPSKPIDIESQPAIQEITVPLTFDAEFFGILQGDMSTLDILRVEEQRSITESIKDLGKDVAKVANPSKYSQSDLGRWRELFDIYLQAGVFFSTNELDHGSRNSEAALKQLQWFQAEVMRRGIVKSFKLSASRDALKSFVNINLTLLRNIKFQEINQLAISKILKKFDKRTSLGAKNAFPLFSQSDSIMSETMAKTVCAEVSKEIVRIVPQLDDYLCPVCYSISYKPVRLTCGHVFCIRCMIRMQKARAKFCPLCRTDVIMDADSGKKFRGCDVEKRAYPANLDTSLMNFLQKYFPKETKAKQRENEIAVGVEMYGESYADAKCSVM